MASIRSASARILRSSRSLLPKATSRSIVRSSTSSLWVNSLPTTSCYTQHRFFADQRPAQPAFNSSLNVTPSQRLYVGNLFFEVTGQQLQDLFAPFGSLQSTKIINDYKGFSKGYGFVEFGSVEEAVKAKEALDQTVFAGRSLVINFVRPLFVSKSPPKPSEPTSTLFVGNLAYNLTDKELNNLFRPLSNIRDVRVAIDRRTGQPRGFAHADFLDVKSAIAAQKYLNGLEVSGRVLRCDFSISGRNQAMMQYQQTTGGVADGEQAAEQLEGQKEAAAEANIEAGTEAAAEQGEVAEAETSAETPGVKA